MQTEMGKTRKRGYICYPGLMYTYGLPYPPKVDSVALGTYYPLLIPACVLRCGCILSFTVHFNWLTCSHSNKSVRPVLPIRPSIRMSVCLVRAPDST